MPASRAPCQPALARGRYVPDDELLKAAPIVHISLHSTSSSKTWLTNLGAAVLTFVVALTAAACSSGHTLPKGPKLFTARQLTTRVLPAPYGYKVDPTPHASGAITRALFDQYGGVRSPSKFGLSPASSRTM